MGVMNSVLDMLRCRRLGKHSGYEGRDLSWKCGFGYIKGRDGDPKTRGKIETVQRACGKRYRRTQWIPSNSKGGGTLHQTGKGAAGEMGGKPEDRDVKPREESVSKEEWTAVSNAAKEVKQDQV